MATYPIKMLKDEEGKPFVPLISIDSIKEVGGETLEQQLDKKLETTNIIAGTQIALEVEGNNVIISNSAEGTKLINNLDQTTAGVGALDAAQGKVLKESIPEVINNLTTIDSTKALSAHQGYVLAGRSVPVGGGTGQVLMKSADDDYSVIWGDAADPNAIVGDGSIRKIVELTYEEYQALEAIDPNTEYHIIDAQSAIDSLQATLNNLQEQITLLKNNYSSLSNDTGWIKLDLINGATNFTNGRELAYRKIGKIVYLSGLIAAPVTNDVLPIAYLPVGFRPHYDYESFVIRNGAGYCKAGINRENGDGAIWIQGAVAGETSLSNVSFIADN